MGLDCAAAETYGSDTIRLKENNLRIHFDDTSNSGSFAANDWRIGINGSENGDPSYFAIEDATAGRTPFRVQSGAPANSMWIDNAGRIGVGTPTPSVEMHIRNGDSPSLRLEQDGSSGFAPQVFDIVANETNFFVRDVTNGSSLIFRARPGAPTNSLFIAADGNIGLGTASPAARLHVAGGDLRVDGAVYQLSSRAAKTDLMAMDASRLLSLLAELDLFNWRYNTSADQGQHFGPTAEDFHAVFGLGETDRHISVADMAGVALGAAQALQSELTAKDRELEDVKARLERLERLLAAESN